MNQAESQEQRLIWAFWLAAGLAVLAGVLPVLIGGTSSRVATVIVPFGVGAAAFAGCAVLHSQGRGVTSALYFLAGLALVYGMLAMFSLPLQLAMLGTCPAPPAACTDGLQRPLTVAENTGMGVAAAFAITSIFVGFFGLVVLFRRPGLPAYTPPVRKIPPIAAPAPADPFAAASPAKATGPENGSAPPPDEPELPAHHEEERPELPPHESTPPTT
ncbi:MAG: hypothetical protein E6I05_11155 [Chloroflexi bacterium]|nr:MAG: hypothetical protein E6J46_04955 [Chloroflexota bacterium]TMF92065.1 MAG: hypothetical protein E6I05_11155 [Chloroflexota bacterium]